MSLVDSTMPVKVKRQGPDERAIPNPPGWKLGCRLITYTYTKVVIMETKDVNNGLLERRGTDCDRNGAAAVAGYQPTNHFMTTLGEIVKEAQPRLDQQ